MDPMTDAVARRLLAQRTPPPTGLRVFHAALALLGSLSVLILIALALGA